MITIVFADISGKENLIAITIVGSAFIRLWNYSYDDKYEINCK